MAWTGTGTDVGGGLAERVYKTPPRTNTTSPRKHGTPRTAATMIPMIRPVPAELPGFDSDMIALLVVPSCDAALR
jgi:hypothetical protein